MKQYYKNIFASILVLFFVLFTFTQSNAQTYCIPTYNTGCAVGDDIKDVILVGDLAPGINNLNTPCSASSYTDYTTISANLTAGFTYNGNVTTNYGGTYENVRIWIDYNNDGIFQATEQIGVLASIGNTSTGAYTFTVPITQAAGSFRMRVRLVYSTPPASIDPCNQEYYGEAHDYKVNITASTPCTGLPNAGTVPATLGVCASIPFTLSSIGSTLAGNMSTQWQRRNPAGTGTWTNIVGATSASYTIAAGITTATDYRYISTCITSTLSDTTTVLAVTINPANQCYCIPTTPSGGDDYINSFTTTGATQNISKLNTGFTAPGYANYSATDTLTVYQGTTVSFNTIIGTNWDQFGQRIWIDYDMGGSFNNTNEKVFESSGTSLTSPIAGSFTIPLSATPGITRMRVRIKSYDQPDPCAPFGSYEYGEAEDYTVNILQLPLCSTITQPASITIDADHDTVCVSQDVKLTLLTPLPPSTGITYQYQSSTSAVGPWTNIGTPQASSTVIVPNVSTPTFFRLQVYCSATLVATTLSNVLPIIISNPAVVTNTPGTRCGPGTVALSATPSANSSIKWYTTPTGGLPLGTGNTFTTPYITQTTNFYAGAGVGGGNLPPAFIGVGTASTSGSPSPYYNLYDGVKSEYLIRASEMTAAGFSAGLITKIGFDVLGAGSVPLQNFTIKIGNTALTTLGTGSWQTGVTQVYSTPSLTTTANTVNQYTFTTPFVWDGTSNIVIQTCYYNGSYGGTYATVKYTTGLAFNGSHYVNQDGNPSICSQAGITGYDYTATSRPNIQFTMVVGCESPRVAVAATVTSAPTLALTYDTVICNNTTKPIAVTSPLANYASYVWTPTTGLFTNAAGTTPYTGGNASTVYFKSTTAGLHTYSLAASNGTLQTNCASADTARIWVQPGGTIISAMPDTICVSGTTDLKLVPDSNYKAGSIQWQQSPTGVTYTNIPGANAAAYTTANLTSEHYYKAVISAQAGVCSSPIKHILISNPQVLSVQDSFHCGPGTVTLGAVGAINTSLKWYENSTGGLSVGAGSSYTTPYLLQTDTFYVTSGVGGGASVPTFIGAGTASTTGNPSPYYNLYDGNRNQYLIKASELQAAGFSAGLITELGLDVLGIGSVPLLNWTIKMGATSLTTLSSIGWETGLTQVYTTPSLTTTANTVNAYTFATPYPWDGVSNIIIETCYYNGTWGGTYATVKYTTGLSFNASHYQNQDGNASICTQASTASVGSVATSRPNFRFTMVTGCESPRQPVIAHIRPVPAVNLGNDFNVCVDAGANFTLDAGTFPNTPTYLWDNNTTSQTRGVNTTGSYSVAVTNSYGCTGRDTVNVTLRNNPLVDLGNDTTVCEGIILTLDAGNDGISYFWNTGENTNSIDVDHSGTYTVIVTNSIGCTKTDTIKVIMSGHIPTIDGISVNNLGPKTFKFQPINPQNAVLYDWDFGDGSAHSPMVNPTHTFPNETNYLVKLKILGTCGQVLDSTNIYIVGLDDVSTAQTELFIYPNPTTGKAKIVNKGNLIMEHVEVFNVLGQKVYSQKADSPKQHDISLESIASGIYTVQILTDEGSVTQKLEIVR